MVCMDLLVLGVGYGTGELCEELPASNEGNLLLGRRLQLL